MEMYSYGKGNIKKNKMAKKLLVLWTKEEKECLNSSFVLEIIYVFIYSFSPNNDNI